MIYRIEFGNTITDIIDTLSLDSDIIELEGFGDEPVLVSTINNDEDKLAPILAKQLSIEFISTATVGAFTFMEGADDRFKVEHYRAGVMEFVGFLVMDEIVQEFQDEEDGYSVAMVATDNIGLLKDVPLTDEAGENPRGYLKIISIIALCLSKTGLSLPIKIVNNICLETAPGVPFYNSCFLQMKTFEDEINVSEDCYTVLEKILGESCRLTQYQGEWWIIRVDEYEGTSLKVHSFSSTGLYFFTDTRELNKYIGFTQDMFFINEAADIGGIRPAKEVAEKYSFEYPKEIVDNIDFERGAWISLMDETFTEDGLTKQRKFYTLDDWSVVSTTPSWFNNLLIEFSTARVLNGIELVDYTAPTFQAVTRGARIGRTFYEGYEETRYVQLDVDNINFPHFLLSSAAPVDKTDKLTISLDIRLESNISGGDDYAKRVIVWLSGSNGINYFGQGVIVVPAGTEDTEYSSASFETAPLPVAGELRVLIPFNQSGLDLGNFGSIGTIKSNVNNLQITYKPFINGSYQVYNSHEWRITQNIEVRNKYKGELKLDNSPKPLFKGALFRYNGIKYVLAGRFYDGAKFSTLPGDENLHPYGHIVTNDVFNQKNRSFVTLDFEAQGIGEEPDMVHQYAITDTSSYTESRWFILVHFEKMYNGEWWTGKMVEVFGVDKEYLPTELKYITER